MIHVSVVYAEAQQQWLRELKLDRGCSVMDAIEASGILQDVPALHKSNIHELELGVFSLPAQPDDLLEEGDRVEIYRALTADPKEVRRQLALLGASEVGRMAILTVGLQHGVVRKNGRLQMWKRVRQIRHRLQ